jgi:hypothetical protein
MIFCLLGYTLHNIVDTARRLRTCVFMHYVHYALLDERTIRS